jgi:hypothetical protein
MLDARDLGQGAGMFRIFVALSLALALGLPSFALASPQVDISTVPQFKTGQAARRHCPDSQLETADSNFANLPQTPSQIKSPPIEVGYLFGWGTRIRT